MFVFEILFAELTTIILQANTVDYTVVVVVVVVVVIVLVVVVVVVITS